MATMTPEERTATAAADPQLHRPVTLMNRFVVPDGSDDHFVELWTETSEYFRTQPGFLSLRLHRAVTPGAEHRYINVARWAAEADYRAPHGTDEFRRLVTQEAWQRYPSSPLLYEVVVAVGDDLGSAP